MERPVYYKGEQVSTWRFYSNALAIFLLKAHRPERYRVTARNGAVARALGPKEQAETARACRAMFERVWPHPREEQDREAAVWARDYPPTLVPVDRERDGGRREERVGPGVGIGLRLDSAPGVVALT